jgi:hypothetical protein
VGKKVWNENLVQIHEMVIGLQPIVDLQLGKSSDGKASYTYKWNQF